MWPYIVIAVCIVIGVVCSIRPKKAAKAKRSKEYDEPGKAEAQQLPIQGAYQKAWLFSYNEKDAYSKLKSIADELGYTIFAKVRLLDLLEPVKGTPKYKTYFYKIQSKHVDFVLCDKKLVARYIIELDDGSHDTAERRERDKFVDEVVQSVGYQIIHVRVIDETIRQFISPAGKQEGNPTQK